MYKLYLNQESMKGLPVLLHERIWAENLSFRFGYCRAKALRLTSVPAALDIAVGLLRVVRWDALFQNEFFWANKSHNSGDFQNFGLSQVRGSAGCQVWMHMKSSQGIDWLPKSECCVYGTDFALFMFPVAIRVGSPYYRDFWNGSRAADKKWSAGLAVALTSQRFHLMGKCFWTMDPVLGSRNRLVFFQTGEHVWDITLCILLG